jgi:hypothetical protein
MRAGLSWSASAGFDRYDSDRYDSDRYALGRIYFSIDSN